MIWGYNFAIIKINTIEGLINLKKELHQDLILELTDDEEGDISFNYSEDAWNKIKDIKYELMIYDNYIE